MKDKQCKEITPDMMNGIFIEKLKRDGLKIDNKKR